MNCLAIPKYFLTSFDFQISPLAREVIAIAVPG